MFRKKPNEFFRVLFRSQHKGLKPSDFNVFCEDISDFSIVPLTLSVAEISRGTETGTGDYYVDGLVFQNEGDYLLTIEIPSKNVTLKTTITIREDTTSQESCGDTFGIIY
jgi:hypothetical protein